MKKIRIKSFLLTLVIMGVMFSVGYGFGQPSIVLSAQMGRYNMQNYRWHQSPYRYWRGFYNVVDAAPMPDEPVEKETPEVEHTGLSYEQSKMLELVNQERAKAGVSPLKFDPELANVASVKAKDMVDNNYFSHDSPTYGSPFTMMQDFGIKYTAAGENLAGYNSVDKAHVGLMNSDGHRKNILNSNFTHIGIGVHKSPRYGYVFVQMFIRK